MPIRGGFARRTVHLTTEEIFVRLGSGRRAPHTSPRGLHLSAHSFVFALSDRQLIPLHGDFPLQNFDPFPVAHGEPFRHGDRLGIADLPGEAASPLGIIQLLPLPGEFPFRRGERIPHRAEADLGVEEGGV